MKISVITPIYKAEKYIGRCVHSLMRQTIKQDIEFIFVNDCTPDSSMDILKAVIGKYPERKEQVTIIENPKNLGPSDSRKIAFHTAHGKYIACCDADDWVNSKMYEEMYKATNNEVIDIVVCNYRVEEGNKSRNCVFVPSSTPQEALAMLHERSYFSYAMWNQLIRRELVLKEIDQIIPTKIREDTYLMMRVYYSAQSIAFIPGIYYHYFYENDASLVHNYDDSYKAWIIQKKNMDKITHLLYQDPEGYNKYHYALNNFKYARKQDYRNAFSSLKQFYNEYRETHTDYVDSDGEKHNSKLTQIKMKIIYDTNFIFFWLYNKLIKNE